MSNKTALILGCNGQDGSLLSHLLLNKGYKIIGLTRTTSDEKNDNLKKLGIKEDINLVKGDIKNYGTIFNLIDKYHPEQIYNLAAQSSVGRSFAAPIETLGSICLGTINLLEAAKELGYNGRIFFAGSSEMYGDTLNGALVSDLQKPSSPYSIGKQTSFNLVKLYRSIHNLNCITGVLFNHESQLRPQTFITQKVISAAKAIKKDKHLKIKLGNIDVARDWGWAPEYMEAIHIITNAKDLKDYVICTGKATSLKTYISKVFKSFELTWENHIEIDQSLFRPNEIMQSYGNPDPLLKDLGWKAKVDIDGLIQRMVE